VTLQLGQRNKTFYTWRTARDAWRVIADPSAGTSSRCVELTDRMFSLTSLGVFMRKSIGLVLVLSLAGCAVCKSSDSPEVCRTKERNHSQPHADLVRPGFITPRFVMFSLLSYRGES
jgi:hypothetical protein